MTTSPSLITAPLLCLARAGLGDDSPPLPRARPGEAARSTGEFSNGTSGENYSGINTGKRDSDNTDLFIRDLRERVLGTPEISTDGFHPYRDTIRHAFGKRVAHGVISKTYSVTDLRKDAAHRYSPAAVVAVSREAVIGEPTEISTSYAERSNLSIRMGSRRFTRLTNGFSKKLENHAAAVSLYVAYYNLCRVHETLTPNVRHQTTPAMALGLTDHPWSIGELLEAALATDQGAPENAPEQGRRFRVIEGGKS
jgi:IS1 family transposase